MRSTGPAVVHQVVGAMARAAPDVSDRGSELLLLLGRPGRIQHDVQGARADGTEVDCTSAGKAEAFAWFELVPAASVRVRLQGAPG